jgi:DNA/RNA endonuclease YhcR with UshA esterase domain
MQKIKSFLEGEKGKDIMTIAIVILVGISSFFLGRLSNQTSTNGLKIEYTGQEASAIGANKTNFDQISINPSVSEKTNNNSRGSYFASKKGKKYYSAGCPAGKIIKQENRIYFYSTTEAENAGYTLSSSC